MESGPGLTMWTTGPGRPALGAWKVGTGQQEGWAKGAEGGHMVVKKVNTGRGRRALGVRWGQGNKEVWQEAQNVAT